MDSAEWRKRRRFALSKLFKVAVYKCVHAAAPVRRDEILAQYEMLVCDRAIAFSSAKLRQQPHGGSQRANGCMIGTELNDIMRHQMRSAPHDNGSG